MDKAEWAVRRDELRNALQDAARALLRHVGAEAGVVPFDDALIAIGPPETIREMLGL